MYVGHRVEINFSMFIFLLVICHCVNSKALVEAASKSNDITNQSFGNLLEVETYSQGINERIEGDEGICNSILGIYNRKS